MSAHLPTAILVSPPGHVVGDPNFGTPLLKVDNRAFVMMQYIGYLRRNPSDPQDTDYTGYDFWLTKLNQFNGNFIQAEMVRAFISSAEYRQRFGKEEGFKIFGGLT